MTSKNDLIAAVVGGLICVRLDRFRRPIIRKLEIADTLLLRRHIFLFFLFAIFRKIPIVFFLFLVFEPFGVVCKLYMFMIMSISSQMLERTTYQIPSAHSRVLSRCVLCVFGSLHRLVFCFLLIHPRLLPLCKRLWRHRCQVRSQFVSLLNKEGRSTVHNFVDERFTHLDFQEFLQTDDIRLFGFLCSFPLGFKHKSWW